MEKQQRKAMKTKAYSLKRLKKAKKQASVTDQ